MKDYFETEEGKKKRAHGIQVNLTSIVKDNIKFKHNSPPRLPQRLVFSPEI